jgi:hypothetical protein
MNFKVQQFIKDVVADKIANADRFTAYDITQVARKEFGRSENIPHYGADGVQEAVHNLFLNGDMVNYTRTNEKVGTDPSGNDTLAWVYHPVVASTASGSTWNVSTPTPSTGPNNPFLDPNALSSRYAIPTPVTTPLVTPSVTVTTANIKPADGLPIMKGVSSHNRLRIPKYILDKAGFSKGEDAWVTFDTDDKVIVVSKYPGAFARHFKVDAYGNIRIGLSKVGIVAQLWELDVEADHLSASKVIATGVTINP